MDLVEELVIEPPTDVVEPPVQHSQIHDHAGGRIRDAADRDLGPIGMAVDLLAGGAERRARDGVGGLEAK
jgi:hypothetical protein